MPIRRLVPSKDWIVIRGEDSDAHEDLVWYLDEDVGDEERRPAIGFARTFADLVQISLSDEARHDLLDQSREDGGQHEDTEYNVL